MAKKTAKKALTDINDLRDYFKSKGVKLGDRASIDIPFSTQFPQNDSKLSEMQKEIEQKFKGVAVGTHIMHGEVIGMYILTNLKRR